MIKKSMLANINFQISTDTLRCIEYARGATRKNGSKVTGKKKSEAARRNPFIDELLRSTPEVQKAAKDLGIEFTDRPTMGQRSTK